MDYGKILRLVPTSKREVLSDKLVDFILTTKNDEKMPNQLARAILRHWQDDILKSDSGLVALLEAATLLEPEKTIGVLNELQIVGAAEQIQAALQS